jgi:acetyl esterase
VLFHGGGWVLGSIDDADHGCRAITHAATCVVVSVGYRLAPEHRFPAAVEDAYAAVAWVADNQPELGGDGAPIAVAGESAGGNLAAAVALLTRDRGGPPLGRQILIYPVTDHTLATHSYQRFGSGYWLTRQAMESFWDHYLPEPEERAQPYAAPLCSPDLDGLPPALIITAEFDVLRDEGEAYAKRLREAGVPVVLSRYDGLIHGFWSCAGVVDRARTVTEEIAASLRHFGESRRYTLPPAIRSMDDSPGSE